MTEAAKTDRPPLMIRAYRQALAAKQHDIADAIRRHYPDEVEAQRKRRVARKARQAGADGGND